MKITLILIMSIKMNGKMLMLLVKTRFFSEEIQFKVSSKVITMTKIIPLLSKIIKMDQIAAIMEMVLQSLVLQRIPEVIFKIAQARTLSMKRILIYHMRTLKSMSIDLYSEHYLIQEKPRKRDIRFLYSISIFILKQ